MPADLTHLDRTAARASFERAARTYETHAVLQREVGKRLLERIEYVREPPRRIIDIGCGTGLPSRRLQERFPDAAVVALDWSKAMLHRVRQASGETGPGTLCGDMQALPLASRSMDLVYSNLAAQWSPDPERMFAEVRRILHPGGLFLFSTFGPDTLQELRAAWAAADEHPHVHEFIDLHDLGDLLVSLGFVEPVMDMDMFTVEYREVKGLMRDLQAIGARNAAAERRHGLTGKQRFARMLQAYERFRKGERYPSTWEVVYGAAFGPVEGQPVRTAGGEVAEFSVDSLRTRRRGEDR